MDDWSFRYRFSLGARMAISVDTNEWLLTDEGDAERVVLRSMAMVGDAPAPISGSPNLVLRGSGYPSSEAVEDAAQRWLHAVLLAFAANNLGADFGLRNPESVVQFPDLSEFTTAEHPVVLADSKSLQVFPTDPPPLFVKAAIGEVTVGKNASKLREAIQLAHSRNESATDAELRAFDTYSSSFGMAPDPRLITLVSAAEILLGNEQRPESALALIDSWTAELRSSDLPATEKDSILGALNYMRTNSIGARLTDLAAGLNGRRYQGEEAAKFLKHCYTLRSRLVHGGQGTDWAEVNLRGAELERLVGDLISVRLSDKFVAEPGRTFQGAQIASDWDRNLSSIPFEPTERSFIGPDGDEPEPLA